MSLRISIQDIFKMFLLTLSTDIIYCKPRLNYNELCLQCYIRIIVVIGLYKLLVFLSQIKLHAILCNAINLYHEFHTFESINS